MHPNTYDGWHAVVILEAEGTRAALRGSVSMCRAAFESASNLKMLGYSRKPTLYVVAWVSAEHRMKMAERLIADAGSCSPI